MVAPTTGSLDANQLYAYFAASIQPDEATRQQAELHLKEVMPSKLFF